MLGTQEFRDSISTGQDTRISNNKKKFVNSDLILYFIIPRGAEGTEEKSEVRCYGEFLTF